MGRTAVDSGGGGGLRWRDAEGPSLRAEGEATQGRQSYALRDAFERPLGCFAALAMTEPLRKGWCPGALRPMRAGDGLIVRVKPTCGILPAATARALADLAERHGNGRLDVTAHANLQMRGVDETALPALVAALGDLGLLDESADAEAVRNVIASPFAGLHDGLDIRPLVAGLETRLTATRALHALPGQVRVPHRRRQHALARRCRRRRAVRLDRRGLRDRPRRNAAGCRAARRLWRGSSRRTRRGDRPRRARPVQPHLFPEARRMRDLVAALGADKVTDACRAPLLPSREKVPAHPADEGASPERALPWARHLSGGAPSSALRAPSPARGEGGSRAISSHDAEVLTLAPAYGRLDAGMLRLAADLTEHGELRLTPWRSLLVPGAGPKARERARRAGFIVDPHDPRRAVVACVGAPECSRATTATRADADALADLVTAIGGTRPHLHVSGCVKGCALAAPAPVTLVGRDGFYDLVVEGRAGDAPVRRGLDLAAVRDALTSPAASTPPAGRPPGSSRA